MSIIWAIFSQRYGLRLIVLRQSKNFQMWKVWLNISILFDLGTCSVLGLKTCERHHQSLPLLLLFKDRKSFISKRELMKLTYLTLINASLAWRNVSTKKLDLYWDRADNALEAYFIRHSFLRWKCHHCMSFLPSRVLFCESSSIYVSRSTWNFTLQLLLR